MEAQGQHDLATLRAAVKDYRPGLLVGNKTSSNAITHEYAKADPVYVDKTIALPQTYSHYRPIQGDGNSGWRAIGFSYFEMLIESGDQAKVEGEVVRLCGMNQMLLTVGGYTYFEDWADEMIGLLREVAQNINNPPLANTVVQERWNDHGLAGGIICYLRILGATYLKANAATYEPFLTEVVGGIQGYCSQSIELVDREIEHLGIVALVNVLLMPVNFVLEIAYLDRGPGSQVNQYRFPKEANGRDLANIDPIIYLLYHPDHYDILYRAPPIPLVSVPAAPVSVQVNRVSGFSHNTEVHRTHTNIGQSSTVDFGALATIPGLDAAPSMGGLAPLAPPPPTSSAPEPFSSVQHSPWMASFPEGWSALAPQAALPPPSVMPSPQPRTPPTLMSAILAVGPNHSTIATSSLGPQTSLMPPLRTTPGYHIRFSPAQLEYEESKNSFPESTFQVTTNAFKNSVWNRAHYRNPDFHPDEWSPDDEQVDGRDAGKGKSKKETS
ncbi:peptidase C65 Otubain-domain-containing protein [Ilyonectria robusta]|uniref:peptidase C65 Otubain-domain-containing protein n=1 Tax=Ilyonectria robusta TaxID=1079257 RepID=UPI001E8D7CEE|nr:peptidase C65 Otubain-domain-containing protein [Ilyonectria robusta]KAH8659728.1 peptidase C65 Otubain-domain-containing protein [Ilyonectria robusta]